MRGEFVYLPGVNGRGSWDVVDFILQEKFSSLARE